LPMKSANAGGIAPDRRAFDEGAPGCEFGAVMVILSRQARRFR